MNARRMNPDEIYTVQEWFRGHHGISPPTHILSSHGFMAGGKGKGVAAVFLFPVIGAQVAFIGWPTVNPDVDKLTAFRGLKMAYEEAEYHAKTMGYIYLQTFATSKTLENRYTKMNYKSCGEGLEMLKLINGGSLWQSMQQQQQSL